VAVGRADALPSGIYRYRPERHELRLVKEGDRRRELGAAALGQDFVTDGAVVIALSAVYARTTELYGERGVRYVHMEAGHAAQNVWLEATAIGLGTVAVGAFDDGAVKQALSLARDEQPLCLMPVGWPA
jgi:SagB-type dehydrogenase family enzyme